MLRISILVCGKITLVAPPCDSKPDIGLSSVGRMFHGAVPGQPRSQFHNLVAKVRGDLRVIPKFLLERLPRVLFHSQFPKAVLVVRERAYHDARIVVRGHSLDISPEVLVDHGVVLSGRKDKALYVASHRLRFFENRYALFSTGYRLLNAEFLQVLPHGAARQVHVPCNRRDVPGVFGIKFRYALPLLFSVLLVRRERGFLACLFH